MPTESRLLHFPVEDKNNSKVVSWFEQANINVEQLVFDGCLNGMRSYADNGYPSDADDEEIEGLNCLQMM